MRTISSAWTLLPVQSHLAYPGLVLATCVMHLTWVFMCNQEETYLADKAIFCVPQILPLIQPAAATDACRKLWGGSSFTVSLIWVFNFQHCTEALSSVWIRQQWILWTQSCETLKLQLVTLEKHYYNGHKEGTWQIPPKANQTSSSLPVQQKHSNHGVTLQVLQSHWCFI